MLRRFSHGRSEFHAWASTTGPWRRRLAVAALLAMIVATSLAIGVLGERLVREAPLLWFGERAEATLRSADVQLAGHFKDGAPKHRVLLGFEFATPDGRRFSGKTERNDVRYLPTLKPGDRIAIRYNQADPARSVAEYNLDLDVSALMLFLPFLAIFGIGVPGWYLLSLRGQPARQGGGR